MTPEDITATIKAALDLFPPIQGKPTDEHITRIVDVLTPILLDIPYDEANAIHSLVGLIASSGAYVKKYSKFFLRPTRIKAYDPDIKTEAKAVDRARAEKIWSARQDDFKLFEAAERGLKLFLTTVVEDTWYKELKDPEMFYTDVTANDILKHLRARSGGLHTIDIIDLTAEMVGYYATAKGIPEYINMLEDAQLKDKRAKLPITNETLVAIATKAILSTNGFPAPLTLGKT